MQERFKLISAVHLVLTKDKKELLMLRRFNTGYEDGKYSLIAGHLDENETVRECLIREAREEAGLLINLEDLYFFHVMHRKVSAHERINFFFSAERYLGIPKIVEPDKCDDLSWFDMNNLPSNTIPYIKSAIEYGMNNQLYSEYGWHDFDKGCKEVGI